MRHHRRPASGVLRVLQPGPGDPIAVSAAHGHGTGDLLDACYEKIDFDKAGGATTKSSIKVAVISKPNVGKSSLINRVAGEGG